MLRGRKAFLFIGPIVMLIGAAAPHAVEAESAVEAWTQAGTASRNGTRGTASQDGQSDVLRQRVTLELVDAPLSSALEVIARLAGLTLAYNSDILPAGRTITLKATDLSARDALARVLEGTGLEPTLTRTAQLTLVRQPDPAARNGGDAAAALQQAVVTGKVTDEATGAALRGVQVRVEQLELSTVTDAEGRYTLEDVPPGTHTLFARIIGYREGRQEVTVTAGTTVSVDFALAVSAVPLDEVVVTGTMVPTRMRAVPSPVSVITAEDIERKGIIRFEDVLRSIPGIGVTGSGGDDPRLFFLYVRGASTLGANTIKAYIDGVEVANPVYSLNQIDPASVERIELIRGPQASTLHGSEAVAGVLQIFTKKGHAGNRHTRVQAAVSAGNLESPYANGFTPVYDYTAAVTTSYENISFRVGTSYKYTGEWVEDGLIDQLGWDLHNSAVRDIGVTAGMRYQLGRVTAEATARFNDNFAGFPLSRALADRARNGQWNYPHATKPQGMETRSDSETYGLSIEFQHTPFWTHFLTVGHDRTLVDFRQPEPRVTTPADTFLVYQSLDWKKRSVAYRSALEICPGASMCTTLQLGFDRSAYNQKEVLTLDADQLTGGLGNDRANLTLGDLVNHGFFVQAQAAWRDHVFLTTGLRADKSTGFGDDLGYAWSSRAGMAYVLDVGRTTLKARASYGTAIRPPQPEQKLGRTGGTFVTLPNERLEAEAQTGYDIGLELHLEDRLSVGVTRYEQDAKDLVALVGLTDPHTVPVMQQHQNIGRIKNDGWEFEGTAKFGDVTIRGHWAVLNSTVEQLSPSYTGSDFAVGDTPLWVPRTTGDVSITQALSRGAITLAMTHQGAWNAYRNIPYLEALLGTDPDREPFRGSRAEYIDRYPAVRRYAVNGSYRITGQVTVLLGVDNLFNDRKPRRTDIDLVKGRQTSIGIRIGLDP